MAQKVCANCGRVMEGNTEKCPAGSNHKLAAVEFAEEGKEPRPSKLNKTPQT